MNSISLPSLEASSKLVTSHSQPNLQSKPLSQTVPSTTSLSGESPGWVDSARSGFKSLPLLFPGNVATQTNMQDEESEIKENSTKAKKTMGLKPSYAGRGKAKVNKGSIKTNDIQFLASQDQGEKDNVQSER